MEIKHYYFVIPEGKEYDIVHCYQTHSETVAFGLSSLEGAWAMAEVKAKTQAVYGSFSPVVETIPGEVVRLFFPKRRSQKAWVVKV